MRLKFNFGCEIQRNAGDIRARNEVKQFKVRMDKGSWSFYF